MKRASVFQYLGYVFGRRLPDEFRDWVRDDLTGPGAVRRHMIRYAIPPLLILAPFWLLPASLYVHLEMTAPIYIWSLLMALALNKVWRRHRLAQHGFDPKLLDDIAREKNARYHDAYIAQVRAASRRCPQAVEQQPVLAAVERLDDLVRRPQVDACLLAVGLHRAHLVARRDELPHMIGHFRGGKGSQIGHRHTRLLVEMLHELLERAQPVVDIAVVGRHRDSLSSRGYPQACNRVARIVGAAT